MSDHHQLVVASHSLLATMEPFRTGQLVNQLSWQIGSLEEVVNAVDYLDKNAKLRRVGRDAPGSNYHAYAYDPDGYVNEVYYGMEQVGWDGCSKPVSMYKHALRETPQMPRDPEYKEVQEARQNNEHLNGFFWEEKREAVYEVEGIRMPQPFKLTRLGRIALFVADLDRSIDFYTKVLGLKVTEVVAVRGHTCAFLRADDEHHTLILMPEALKEVVGFGASYGLPVATYSQLRSAYEYFSNLPDVTILEDIPELSPGIHYGFWVKGPDPVAVHIYYGMDRVTDKSEIKQTRPVPYGDWPTVITHGEEGWFDPPFNGPWA
jgi:catechol 2,3-dioxygenase-like lactoylglutathione lyase family enzyme